MHKKILPLNLAPVGGSFKHEEERKMKKYAWIVALLLALSLAFVGCRGEVDENAPQGGGGGEEGFVHDFGAFELKLGDNYQYGDGYQGNINDAKLMAGKRIMAGDAFTLEIEFTVSRSWEAGVDEDMQIGLVDRSDTANYWTPLSWTSGDDDSEYSIPASELVTGTTISKTIDFVALRNATGVAVNANDMTFQFDSTKAARGQHGSTAALAGEVTLSFTKFIFTKLAESVDIPFECTCSGCSSDCECEEGDCPENCGECCETGDEFFYVLAGWNAGDDYTVDFTKLTLGDEIELVDGFLINKDDTLNGTNSTVVAFQMIYPEGFDITDYSKFSVLAQLLKDDKTTPADDQMAGTLKLQASKDNPKWGATLRNVYNLGMSDWGGNTNPTDNDISEVEALPQAINFGGTANDVKYIKITSIKFHN